MQYNTIHYKYIIQNNKIHYDKIQNNKIQNNTIRYGTIQCIKKSTHQKWKRIFWLEWIKISKQIKIKNIDKIKWTI